MQFHIGSVPPRRTRNHKKKDSKQHPRSAMSKSSLCEGPREAQVNSPSEDTTAIIVKFLAHVAEDEFKNQGYLGFYNFIESVIKNKFMIQNQKDEFINEMKQFRKKRWLAQKSLHKLKQNYIKKLTPINTSFIDLTPVDPRSRDPDNIPTDKQIRIYTSAPNSVVYVFKATELISLFVSAFAMRDDTCPTPKIPKNPYTGVEFTTGQIIYIFDRFRDQDLRLPLILDIYKTCKFNFDKFVEFSYLIMEENATREYVQESSMEEFVHIIRIHAGNRFLRNICKPFTLENIAKHRKQLETILIPLINGNDFDFEEPIPESALFNTNIIDFETELASDIEVPTVCDETLELIETIENHYIRGPVYYDSDDDSDSDDDPGTPTHPASPWYGDQIDSPDGSQESATASD